MKLENQNDQLMVMAAHRYCLGRQSYIVSDCIEWLHVTWWQIESSGQDVILRDTAAALMDNEAGSSYDAIGWKDFLAWGMQQVGEAREKGVKGSVAWKQKPWPLDPPRGEGCGEDDGCSRSSRGSYE